MIRRTLTVLLLLALPGMAQADNQPVPGMYRFEQPVSDASESNRKAALRAALTTVLVRVTGDRRVAEQPPAQGLLARTDAYVQRYSYTKRPAPAPRPDAVAPPVEPEPELVLRGEFAQRALAADIRAAGLPLWSAQRPRTLALITLDSPDGGRLIGGGPQTGFPELAETAKLRGLPLIFPTADALSFEDVRSANTVAMAAVADALRVDYILLGHLQETAGVWLLEAGLQAHPVPALPQSEEPLSLEELMNRPPEPAARLQWRLRAREPGPLLREALHRVVDHIASEHALAAALPGGEAVVGIWVRGLGSGEDYRRLQKHLERLPVIEKLELVAIRQGVLGFRVSTESSPEELDRSIRRDGKLQPDPLPLANTESPIWTGEFEFHYELR